MKVMVLLCTENLAIRCNLILFIIGVSTKNPQSESNEGVSKDEEVLS